MAESIQRLKERLSRLLHQKDLAAQKASLLQEQLERDRQREQMLTDITHQLMDRQRELNIMLNRANIMLSRSQEANTILSLEFTELCHALPAPEHPELQDRIRRINDLFKTSGISNAEVTPEPSAPEDSAIITPPPRNPPPVVEQPLESNEEVEPVRTGGDGKKTSRAGDARLDDLFRRTGSGEGETAKDGQVETPPIDVVIDEPVPETGPPEPAFASQFTSPQFTEEPFAGFNDSVVPEDPQLTAEESIEDDIAEREPIGMAPSGGGSASTHGRRWWRLLGRRV